MMWEFVLAGYAFVPVVPLFLPTDGPAMTPSGCFSGLLAWVGA